MAPTPLIAHLQEALVGLVIGAGVGLVARVALVHANLRWTWALPMTFAGAVSIAVGGVFASWTIAIASGGVLTAWWTFTDERRDRESGGDARRRVRGAVGPLEMIAARWRRARANGGQVATAREFLLGFGTRGRPVRVRFGGTSGRHGLLLGASGSGKSNALMWCIGRHIDAGFGAVVIDMKGDQLLERRLEAEADAARRAFYRWTLEGGDRWNPLARGDRSELKDKLIASEQFTERHYQAMYERYLLNLFRALEDRPAARHLRTVIRLLDPAEFAMHLRELKDETAAAEIGTYLSRLTNDQTRDLRGLADRLALLIEGGHGDLLTPAMTATRSTSAR